MLGLLIADMDKGFISLVEYVVENNFKDRINTFKAAYLKETIRALEKLPIDMMMINFELAGSPELQFFNDIRNMEPYQFAPMVITTSARRYKVDSILKDQVYQLGIFEKVTEDIEEQLCIYLERLITITEVSNTQHLRFKQKSRMVSVPIRNFILAEPSISGGRKTTIIYVDEKTGLIVEDIITAYTLEKILAMPHHAHALTRLNNGMVANLNRVKSVCRTNHEVTFKDIDRIGKIGGTYKEEIYKVLGIF